MSKFIDGDRQCSKCLPIIDKLQEWLVIEITNKLYCIYHFLKILLHA